MKAAHARRRLTATAKAGGARRAGAAAAGAAAGPAGGRYALRPHAGEALHAQQPGRPAAGPRRLPGAAAVGQGRSAAAAPTSSRSGWATPTRWAARCCWRRSCASWAPRRSASSPAASAIRRTATWWTRCGIPLHDPNTERLPRGPQLHGGHLAAAGPRQHGPGGARCRTTSSWPTTTRTPRRSRRTARARACERVQAGVRGPAGRLHVRLHGRAGPGLRRAGGARARRAAPRPRSASTPTPARCCTARPPSTSGCSRS